jgi:hypothetical protein
MPLYRIDQPEQATRLVYAKTARGAQNHVLDRAREAMTVKAVSPLEGAILAGSGVSVETIGVGADQIFDDCPPQAKRGYAEPPPTAEPVSEAG